ncbi:MAG TPA: hypothetical protein VES20_03650 [Bryobacteraceae bacterium]|nr:hypothetical protein [Bryobacteraceae bacterium]
MKTWVRWLWIAPVLALLYAGITLWLRTEANREIELRAQKEKAEKELKALEAVGGGNLKVLTFYANPPVLSRGQAGLLCYGVASADTARIEPNVGSVSRSLSNCVEVRPKATTEYILTARKAGAEQQARATVRVQ